MSKPIACVLVPQVDPHEDPSRIIGLRTTYHGTEHRYLRGYDVVIVAVLKDALCAEEHGYLTTDEEISAAGGVGPDDRIEVAPILPKEGRLSFVTSDPRAIDLACFAALARHGAGSKRQGNRAKKGRSQ